MALLLTADAVMHNSVLGRLAVTTAGLEWTPATPGAATTIRIAFADIQRECWARTARTRPAPRRVRGSEAAPHALGPVRAGRPRWDRAPGQYMTPPENPKKLLKIDTSAAGSLTFGFGGAKGTEDRYAVKDAILQAVRPAGPAGNASQQARTQGSRRRVAWAPRRVRGAADR